MSPSIRLQVQERAHGLCEYCRCPSNCSPGPFDVDHITPRVLDGPDDMANFSWSCGGCNGFKGARMTAVDPISGEEVALFHPRQQRWSDHFRWSADGLIVSGITPTGRATVERLRLNRREVVILREMLFELGRHLIPLEDV